MRRNDYQSIEQILRERPTVTYTPHWIRVLCRDQKIDAQKIGEGKRGQWLVNVDNLLDYIREKSEQRRVQDE